MKIEDAEIEKLARTMANAKLGEGDSVRCEGPTEFEINQARPWARWALAANAVAPAPASGRVEAVARRAKYLLNRLETDDGLGIGEIDTMLRMAASLSPAATPVSEAGGEAAERSWRRTKFEFIGAMRQALINSGLTREQVIIADNAITEAFSDLAKPASSPAGKPDV